MNYRYVSLTDTTDRETLDARQYCGFEVGPVIQLVAHFAPYFRGDLMV